MRRLLIFLLFVGAISGGTAYYLNQTAAPGVSVKTAPVRRDDLVVTIGATGTVEPEEVIDVGAQVLGKIQEFGTDPEGNPVDYGTPVTSGMVLARIDNSIYAAEVDQARAQLEQARANVLRSRADLEQMKARLIQAERNWKRAQELGPSRALSATEYDNYEATYLTAKATVSVGDAAIVQAEKAVAQAQAALNRAETNLSYCTIRSPVNGVIIDRRVNIGQTVVASLNAPSLFLIAKDLRRMQVWVAVNEADIGQIRSGQPVRFTVDAYPDQTFIGEVGKIRLNASMVQNVVNYIVEVNTDNSDGRLLPYLTANVQFEVDRRQNVLLVPNAALRWTPSSLELVAPQYRGEFESLATSRPARRRGGPASGPAEDQSTGIVWTTEGNFVRPVRVRVGLRDSSGTEVAGEDLVQGVEVVVSEMAESETDAAYNPFAPRFFNRGQRRPGGGGA